MEDETLQVMKTFHFHKLKYLFQCSGVSLTHFQELLLIFYITDVQKTFTQNELICFNNFLIDHLNEINKRLVRLLLLLSN